VTRFSPRADADAEVDEVPVEIATDAEAGDSE
jgi:hypothetical protein